MPSFIIDPVLITAPAPDSNQPELVRWLDSLQAWVKETQSSPFPWHHFYECTHELFAIGRFPSFEILRSIIQRCGADVNAAALTRAINAFFCDESHDFRAVTATRYVIVRDEAAIEPDEIIVRNEPPLRPKLIGCLLCLACDKSIGEKYASTLHLVTMPFKGVEGSVSVHGVIELTDPGHVAEKMGKIAFDERFPVVFSPNDLARIISPADVWQGGSGEFLKAVQRLAAAMDRSPLPSILHADFWQSLEQSTIYTDLDALDKLCRICALVLTGQAQSVNVSLRELRATKAANSRQRVRSRDGASAWRLTITDKGIGWRLHYWHVPTRRPTQQEAIEFANVVRKHDPERIPE